MYICEMYPLVMVPVFVNDEDVPPVNTNVEAVDVPKFKVPALFNDPPI
jgi:hypothetical protein